MVHLRELAKLPRKQRSGLSLQPLSVWEVTCMFGRTVPSYCVASHTWKLGKCRHCAIESYGCGRKQFGCVGGRAQAGFRHTWRGRRLTKEDSVGKFGMETSRLMSLQVWEQWSIASTNAQSIV